MHEYTQRERAGNESTCHLECSIARASLPVYHTSRGNYNFAIGVNDSLTTNSCRKGLGVLFLDYWTALRGIVLLITLNMCYYSELSHRTVVLCIYTQER